MTHDHARSAGLLISKTSLCIPDDYRRICNGNLFAAAILGLYLFKAYPDGTDQDVNQLNLDEQDIADRLGFDRKTVRKWRHYLIQLGVLVARRGAHNALRCVLNRVAVAKLVSDVNRRQKPLFPDEEKIETAVPASPPVGEVSPTQRAKLPQPRWGNIPNAYIGSKNGCKNGDKNTTQPNPAHEAKPEPQHGTGGMGSSQNPFSEKLAEQVSGLVEEFRALPLKDVPTEDTKRNLTRAVAELPEEQRDSALNELRRVLKRTAELIRRGDRNRAVDTWGGVVYRMREVVMPHVRQMAQSRAAGEAQRNHEPQPNPTMEQLHEEHMATLTRVCDLWEAAGPNNVNVRNWTLCLRDALHDLVDIPLELRGRMERCLARAPETPKRPPSSEPGRGADRAMSAGGGA